MKVEAHDGIAVLIQWCKPVIIDVYRIEYFLKKENLN